MKKLGYKITLMLLVVSSISFGVQAHGSSQRPPVKEDQAGVKKSPQFNIKEGQSVRRPPLLRVQWNSSS
jgi:hypothetical protein